MKEVVGGAVWEDDGDVTAFVDNLPLPLHLPLPPLLLPPPPPRPPPPPPPPRPSSHFPRILRRSSQIRSMTPRKRAVSPRTKRLRMGYGGGGKSEVVVTISRDETHRYYQVVYRPS